MQKMCSFIPTCLYRWVMPKDQTDRPIRTDSSHFFNWGKYSLVGYCIVSVLRASEDSLLHLHFLGDKFKPYRMWLLDSVAIDRVLDYCRQAALVEHCRHLQGKVEALQPSRIKPSTILKETFSIRKTKWTYFAEWELLRSDVRNSS